MTLNIQTLTSKFSYEKSYFYLLVLLAISIPLSRAGISLAILSLMLLWVIEGNYKSKYATIKAIPFFQTTFLFFSFMTLSLLWSANIEEGLHYMRLYSYWFIIVIIVTSLNEKYIPYIINAFILAMFVSEILTYGVYFEFWSIKGATRAEPTIFMTHINYSVLLAVTVVLLLNRIFMHQSTKQVKALSSFFLFMVLGNLLISNGRAGLLALIVSLSVLFLVHFRHSIKKLLLTFTALIGILVIAFYSVDNFNHRVKATVNDLTSFSDKHYQSSIGIRLSYWPVTKDIFLENPIMGVGIGGALTASHNEYVKNKYGFADSVIEFTHNMHYFNIFLQTLAQMGIIGLTLIIMLFYKLLVLKIADKEMKIFSFLFTIIFAVASMTEPLWYKQTTIAIFILLVGIFIKLSISKKVSS
jgi:O-antigen ligase